MSDISASSFILHVSDFHLTDDDTELSHASSALEKLASKLISENIKVDYLFHTGDVINSSDLYEKTASELECCKEFYSEANGNKEFNSSEFKAHASPEVKNEFKKKLRQLTTERFQKATELMKKFASHLNIALGNVVICCGNHDVYRPFWTNNVQA